MQTESKQNGYQEVADSALSNYSIGEAHLKYLGQRDHVTFKVETDKEKYLLKIHRDASTSSRIEAELLWLEALSSDTKLIVPKPVRNDKDCLVTEWKSSLVTLHHWVEGVVLNRQPSGDEVIRLSKMMALLHNHAKSWKLPRGFDRPAYDTELLQSYLPKLLVLQESGIITKMDYEAIDETVSQIIHDTSRLEKTNLTWGLIHSDLHESNYVVHQDSIRPIDFSCCGFGYYLFDVAETLLHLYPDNRKLFLHNYLQQRALSKLQVRTLEAFFLWQVIRGYAFHSTNVHEHEWLAKSVPNTVSKYCRKYMAVEHFL
ncbi:phosphotransferase enzyme family protein [Paenibacillus sp. HJGM_3]|uniref:phosphotransferase enzyme family protein n=1 Tax=Paenibacillus sp. HJGM_3 TaxID=3379816 RepID=UPI00385A5518